MAQKALPFQAMKIGYEGNAAPSRDVARFICKVCEAKGDLPLVRVGAAFSPHGTIKRAEMTGWEIRNSTARCPRCAAKKRAGTPGDRPGPKLVSTPLEEAPVASNVTPITTVGPPKKPDIQTQPDKEQRLAIRGLLDRFFDDGTGRYLDGYSDKRIADELAVPRLWVESIRDTAYGPVSEPPELQAVPPALAQMERAIANARTTLDQMEDIANGLRAVIRDGEAKIAAARKALGLAE